MMFLATLRACTDGAANILYDCVDAAKLNRLPHLVSGDFDSARPEVLQFFRDKVWSYEWTVCRYLVIKLLHHRNVGYVVVLK